MDLDPDLTRHLERGGAGAYGISRGKHSEIVIFASGYASAGALIRILSRFTELERAVHQSAQVCDIIWELLDCGGKTTLSQVQVNLEIPEVEKYMHNLKIQGIYPGPHKTNLICPELGYRLGYRQAARPAEPEIFIDTPGTVELVSLGLIKPLAAMAKRMIKPIPKHTIFPHEALVIQTLLDISHVQGGGQMAK